jgi:hypothetical protein
MWLVVAACGGGDDGGGGGNSPDAGMMSTPDAPSSSVSCTSAVDIDGQYTTTSSGTLGIAGTIMLPASLPAGRKVELEVTLETPSVVAGDIKDAMLTSAKTTLTYHFVKLPTDTSTVIVGLRADIDGNESTNDAGDYVGWYKGTVSAPILDSTGATNITISSACRTGVDFGVGVQP